MSITDLQAIDVHAHYGIYVSNTRELVNEFLTGDARTVVERARQARTRLTIVSPLLALQPRFKTDAVAGNEEAARVVKQTEGLMQWVVIDPLKPHTYDQAEEMLESPKCAGIKIHPEEHGYPIAERGEAIFEFAARHRAIVLTHSGQENSRPADFVPLANDFPEVTLILGHLGCGWDGDPTHQVRAIQADAGAGTEPEADKGMSFTLGSEMRGAIEGWRLRAILLMRKGGHFQHYLRMDRHCSSAIPRSVTARLSPSSSTSA